MARDSQPLLRFGVRAVAERDGKRQEGSSGGGGRTTLGYFDGRSPEEHGARRRASRRSACSTRRRRRPGRWRSCSRPATAGSCSTRRSATGSRRTSIASGTSNYADQIGNVGRERALHGDRRRDAAPVARLDQRRRRRQRAASNVLIEKGKPRRLHAGSAFAEALQARSRRATAVARASRARRCRA